MEINIIEKNKKVDFIKKVVILFKIFYDKIDIFL